jgi:hypothetical protein
MNAKEIKRKKENRTKKKEILLRLGSSSSS